MRRRLSSSSSQGSAVLAYLKDKSYKERSTPERRYAIYASIVVARKQEGASPAVPGSGFHSSSLNPLVKNLALLPPDMARVIIAFVR